MEIRELTDESERREAIPILRQLWSDVDPDAVLEWTADDEYNLFGGFDDELVGVAGVLVTDVLHHARHGWLYDLVVDETHRDRGHGTALVEWIEEWADKKGCQHLALASPLAKERTHQYYENREYERWGCVFEKEL